jgi:hypothetical protein
MLAAFSLETLRDPAIPNVPWILSFGFAQDRLCVAPQNDILLHPDTLICFVEVWE